MSTPVVKVENLVKRYKELIAVDHFNLEIREGEILGLLGPNGSGKSTTIRMMMNYVRPTSGTATILGMDSRSQSGKLLSLIHI